MVRLNLLSVVALAIVLAGCIADGGVEGEADDVVEPVKPSFADFSDCDANEAAGWDGDCDSGAEEAVALDEVPVTAVCMASFDDYRIYRDEVIDGYIFENIAMHDEMDYSTGAFFDVAEGRHYQWTLPGHRDVVSLPGASYFREASHVVAMAGIVMEATDEAGGKTLATQWHLVDESTSFAPIHRLSDADTQTYFRGASPIIVDGADFFLRLDVQMIIEPRVVANSLGCV